jgi:hypothetical protein
LHLPSWATSDVQFFLEMAVSELSAVGILVAGLAESPINTRFFGPFGFCAAKTGFDGLSSVVLVRFCSNFPKAPGISSNKRETGLLALGPSSLGPLKRVQTLVF